jgi:hypothetical protein
MLPAGKYYVGDLCYVIAEWNDFCDATLIPGCDIRQGYMPWKGQQLWSHTTAYGDGTYYDESGREYGVDAGLIGVLPVELITKTDYLDENGNVPDLGQIIEFDKPFECEYVGGMFVIGDVSIDTDPSFDDDDDCDDDNNEEEDDNE